VGEETARLRDEIEQTRDELTRDVDRLAEKTSPSRVVERRVHRARGRLVDVKEKIMGSHDPAGVGQGAREQGARVGEAAHGAVSGVRERTEGNPLAAGVVAFGIGWMVSSLMPPSEAETHAAQRAGEAAREHGAPVLDQAKQAAQQVGADLKQQAVDAAEQVKDRTHEAAGTVREEARSSAPA
jgi:hypothetical protein